MRILNKCTNHACMNESIWKNPYGEMQRKRNQAWALNRYAIITIPGCTVSSLEPESSIVAIYIKEPSWITPNDLHFPTIKPLLY